MKKILIYPILIVVFFALFLGLVYNALAYENDEYFDNFESYTVGEGIASQSYWEVPTPGGYKDIIVSNNRAYSGTKSLKATTTTQAIEINQPNQIFATDEIDLDFSFWYYVEPEDNLTFCYIVRDDGSQIISNRCLEPNGWSVEGGGGGYLDTGGIFYGWHKVEVYINCESDQVSFYSDEFLIETVSTYTACDSLDSLRIYTGGANDGLIYIDDFTFQERTISEEVFDFTGINFPNNTTCFIDYPCSVNFFYTDDLIGYTTYSVPNIAGQRDPDFAIASTTLTRNIFYEGYVDLPIETAATTSSYCLFTESPDESESILSCPIDVDYIATSSLPDFSDYNIDDVCDDIPQPAPQDYFDEIRFGVECGFRRLVYWAFVPRVDSYRILEEGTGRMMHSFPFSIYTQIKETVTNTIDNSASSTLAIPLFWGGEVIEDVNLLDQNTMNTGLGSAWTIIDNSLNKFIYFIGFMYFVVRIFKLARK